MPYQMGNMYIGLSITLQCDAVAMYIYKLFESALCPNASILFEAIRVYNQMFPLVLVEFEIAENKYAVKEDQMGTKT